MRDPFSLQMPAERPYGVLLALAIASAGVRNVSTLSTGLYWESVRAHTAFEEAKALYQTDNLHDAVQQIAKDCELAAITMGAQGAMAVHEGDAMDNVCSVASAPYEPLPRGPLTLQVPWLMAELHAGRPAVVTVGAGAAPATP